LRYDKPGCGESGGDWRQQSFEDRAFESVEMLDVLKRHLPDTACVGLAGGSQGGWIVLLAAARSPAVEFVICYSAAGVTPAKQEEYRVAHHLPAEGYTADETAEALALLRARLVSNRAGVPAELIFEREAPARSQRWFALVGGMEPEGLAFDLPILTTTRVRRLMQFAVLFSRSGASAICSSRLSAALRLSTSQVEGRGEPPTSS
jgi:pimeloyl-ACP methyl ester carboxylesterase